MPACQSLEQFIAVFAEGPSVPFGIPYVTEQPCGRYWKGSYRRVDIFSDPCCDGYHTSRWLPAQFVEVPEFGCEPYRTVWKSDEWRAIVTYCEGDVDVTVDDTEKAYQQRLAAAATFYERYR